MSRPAEELASRDRGPVQVGRVVAASVVVLAVAVAAIVWLRPDAEQGSTPLAQASASASASPTPSPTPSASPEPSARPTPTYGPPPVPPPLTANTGSRLAVVRGTHIELLDVDTARSSQLAVDPRLVDNDRIDVLAVGRELVFLGDNQTGAGNTYGPVLATTSGPGSTVRQIGRATGLIRSDIAGRLWLSRVEDGTPAVTTLTEVDLQGGVHRRGRFEGSFGVDPFAGGFLRQTVGPDMREGDDVELIDAGGTRRQLYRGVSVVLVDGNTALLADRVACEKSCELHVLTAGSTVSERTLHLGATPDLLEGKVTGDGSRLVVGAASTDADGAPRVLSELDLHTGKWLRTQAWVAQYYGGSFRVSSDRRWMFFVDADTKSVDAYDLSTHQPYRVKGAYGQITQLEVLAS